MASKKLLSVYQAVILTGPSMSFYFRNQVVLEIFSDRNQMQTKTDLFCTVSRICTSEQFYCLTLV